MLLKLKPELGPNPIRKPDPCYNSAPNNSDIYVQFKYIFRLQFTLFAILILFANHILSCHQIT